MKYSSIWQQVINENKELFRLLDIFNNKKYFTRDDLMLVYRCEEEYAQKKIRQFLHNKVIIQLSLPKEKEYFTDGYHYSFDLEFSNFVTNSKIFEVVDNEHN